MLRTVRLSIIRSLFTVHSAAVYVIQVCRQLSSWTCWSCSKAVYALLWHIPLLSVRRINSGWWTEELSETCRFSYQNKFAKLVNLFCFIIKKFVTMNCHTKVKFPYISLLPEVILQFLTTGTDFIPQDVIRGKQNKFCSHIQKLCIFFVLYVFIRSVHFSK
jgi:hypothetical protein